MNMNWKSIVVVVGFASAVVGLIRAFSFNHYEAIVCNYEAPKKTNILECLDRIIRNNEQVILLKLEISSGAFSRTQQGKYAIWEFLPVNWCQELGLSCSDDKKDGTRIWQEKVFPNLKYNFSANGTSYTDVPFGHYGTFLYLMLDEHTLNPYSDAHADAGIDIANGPFQVSKSNDDGVDKITLTPAPMTDSLGREVRCARKEWPKYVKFFLCPFI